MTMTAIYLVLAISGPYTSSMQMVPMQNMDACNRAALDWVKKSTAAIGGNWPVYTAECVEAK